MKAVITEIRGAKAAALQNDGSVRLLDNKNFKIGQVIEVKTTKWYSKATSWVAAAAAVLLVTSGAVSYAYMNPVTTINVDVNPSVEMRLNTFDKVINAKALNADGEEILKALNLKGMESDEAIEALIEAMIDDGYLNEEDDTADIVITVTKKNEEKLEKLTVDLDGKIKAYVTEAGIEAEVEVQGVGADRVALAAAIEEENEDYAMTPGKLNLLQKLNAAMDEDAEDLDEAQKVIDFVDDLLDDLDKEELSVKDIMKEIKRLRFENGELPEEKAKVEGEEDEEEMDQDKEKEDKDKDKNKPEKPEADDPETDSSEDSEEEGDRPTTPPGLEGKDVGNGNGNKDN
ncbi:anti-sigma-I factor RsgI family protein [Acidaminobacter hydrogenoformans]|uniref:Anti-sigma factor RsgI-like middle domain-containing protein n=1 Tax=Acidaminobacter hydrogenoformans DSM 2784 TaxID=1120920 RepID=A0A1G5S4V6_9FIRM|nr:hypothetical protein [Acidaminobacter hydrogenoformans]SCZ81363.1 hypothetical protein SAMN03080599_02749 [Acidaminobacter hydrogenoformans DSM 2784]